MFEVEINNVINIVTEDFSNSISLVDMLVKIVEEGVQENE